MAIVKNKALILDKKNYSNTSLILDVLTPDKGKVSLIAKGARDLRTPSKSSKFDIIDKLTFATIVYYESHAGLGTLSECAIHYAFPGIRNNINSWLTGAQIDNLLLASSFPGDEASRLLTSSLYVLSDLDSGVNPDLVMCAFLYQFLDINGSLPDFFNCSVTGESLINNGLVQWSPVDLRAYSEKYAPWMEILDHYKEEEWDFLYHLANNQRSLNYIKIENQATLDNILGLLKTCVFRFLGYIPKAFSLN